MKKSIMHNTSYTVEINIAVHSIPVETNVEYLQNKYFTAQFTMLFRAIKMTLFEIIYLKFALSINTQLN